MKLNIQIGQLADSVEEFNDIKLQHNEEVDIRDLGCYVDTPTGPTLINQIIKKENLEGIKVTLENGLLDKFEIKCAKKHILRKDSIDIFADEIVTGDKIDTKYGPYPVISIEDIEDSTYYDIGIDYPHIYYDSDGILHHNTLMTACLSQATEAYGRSIVIVPNKKLVEQTEKDFLMLGLDCGVFYGKRKEYTKTHTICTWQSLNSLNKKTKSAEAIIPIGEFTKDVTAIIVDECLDGETLVTTPNGKKEIKSLKPGDKIYSFNESTNSPEEDEIVKLHKNLLKSRTADMYEIELDDGNVLHITGNHKVLTQRGWVEVEKLTLDDEIKSINTIN